MSNISDELIERNEASGSERVKDQAEREIDEEDFKAKVENEKTRLRSKKDWCIKRAWKAFKRASEVFWKVY
jgi:hypothetical protein